MASEICFQSSARATPGTRVPGGRVFPPHQQRLALCGADLEAAGSHLNLAIDFAIAQRLEPMLQRGHGGATGTRVDQVPRRPIDSDSTS